MRSCKPLAPFADRVGRVWGGLDEIARSADDPQAAMAAFFEVTPDQVQAWRAAEGRHACAMPTIRGTGCRNHASAVIDYDPRVWAARAPVYWPSHSPTDPPSAAPRGADPDSATEDDGRLPAR